METNQQIDPLQQLEHLKEEAKQIKMYSVYSSNLSAIGYDQTSKLLKVIFKGGGTYLYENVEPEVYNKISMSDSKGKTLNESVVRQKDKYKYYKLN